MATKNETETETVEIPTFEIPLVNAKGVVIDKHAAMRKVLAAEFLMPVLSGNLDAVDVEEISRWKNALTKVTQAFDKALLALPEGERNGIEPFRKPRSDKGTTSTSVEDMLG